MLVSMESLMMQPRHIQNKADALHFAILITMKYEIGKGNVIDYDEAEKVYKFFCDHVEFPEEETKKVTDYLMTLAQGLFAEKAV